MKNPNILITGTPGVGKTKLCLEIADKLKLKYYDVSKVVKENNFIESYDKIYECPIVDEDMLLDYLEEKMTPTGNIVEYHSCDLFPERWFHAVFVIRCDNTLLFDRLTLRGYNDTKVKSNVECELLQSILEEAREAYKDEIVFELINNNDMDLATNCKTISNWVKKWRKENK